MSGGKDVPVLLLGGEGSGKTCTLTKFARHMQDTILDKQIARYV